MSRKKRRKRKRHVVMTVLSVIFCMLALLGLVSGYINPYNAPFCEYAQLVLPVVLIVNAVFALYWILVFNPKVLIPLVAIVCNIGYLSRVLQFRKNQAADVKADVRVLTYNVHHFNEGESVYAVADFLKNRDIGIACFQECSPEDGGDFKKIFSEYPYIVRRSEFAILSKYPIDDSSITRFINNGNGALNAVINIKGKTINFITSHLQTTGFSVSKIKYEREGNISLDRAEDNFANNAKVRAAQALELRSMIESSKYPVVFCGDLNDIPSSFSYHKVRGRMKDAFKEAGRGYCYTYLHLLKMLRIDYIFHDPSLKAVEFESPAVEFSDHKPVLVGFAI
ncbi:MAG: endonuclease/exonuclease/phosphatase family protein [Bacteroidales bacterium]|jgi:endonuclease/exonuclease/phosphatase (EEP) superfamily protein YafD|nr:endonuclease/exonuclease/phosphatase family protein [Bacteroidales bacterium]MCI2121707.1 endonuclease/exonuclease/phosphatase family protein [Bacteroidales bacterium]MCI2145789.1 endonuclease/exonuclease/phosphatase family protein [Bacteroidales bacterium]